MISCLGLFLHAVFIFDFNWKTCAANPYSNNTNGLNVVAAARHLSRRNLAFISFLPMEIGIKWAKQTHVHTLKLAPAVAIEVAGKSFNLNWMHQHVYYISARLIYPIQKIIFRETFHSAQLACLASHGNRSVNDFFFVQHQLNRLLLFSFYFLHVVVVVDELNFIFSRWK